MEIKTLEMINQPPSFRRMQITEHYCNNKDGVIVTERKKEAFKYTLPCVSLSLSDALISCF